jgi:hypothetical protein
MTGWSWLIDEENAALDAWFERDNPDPLLPLFEALRDATPDMPAERLAERKAAFAERIRDLDGSDTDMNTKLNDAGCGSQGIM